MEHLFDLDRCRADYAERRFTVIDNVMPTEWCDDVVARSAKHIAAGRARLQQPPTRKDEERFVQGPYLFQMILGGEVRKHFNEISALYQNWTGWFSDITGEEVITSPHRNLTTGEPSDVFYANIKAYEPSVANWTGTRIATHSLPSST